MKLDSFDHGGTVFATARRLGVAPGDILDFSASINPAGPPPGVAEAIVAALPELVHYPDDDCAELTAKLADLHGLSTDEVCVANGSTELIHLIPRLAQGGRALIVSPAFSEYGRGLSRAGMVADHLVLDPEDGFAFSPARLAERLKGGYSLLFLCNPGNPAGNLISFEEVAEVAAICRRLGTFFVLDEAFMDFCGSGSAVKSLGEGGIVLRSLTKFYALPGLRLGYALGSSSVIGRMRDLRLPWSVNTLAQVAGIAALADREYRERTPAETARRRQLLSAGLSSLPGVQVFPSAVNYLLCRLERGSSTELAGRLLERDRIMIRSCSGFHGLDDRWFRVAVKLEADNLRLVEALGRLLS